MQRDTRSTIVRADRHLHYYITSVYRRIYGSAHRSVKRVHDGYDFMTVDKKYTAETYFEITKPQTINPAWNIQLSSLGKGFTDSVKS